MKKLLKSIFIPLVLLLFIGSSCSNDDDSLTGTLELTFSPNNDGVYPTDLRVKIYTIENSDLPIYDLGVNPRETSKIPLNIGNYIIKPYVYGTSSYYVSAAFQVRKDHPTTIHYNQNKQPVFK